MHLHLDAGGAEMRHRVESLIGPGLAKGVTLSTFHSFCMQVLRREIDKLVVNIPPNSSKSCVTCVLFPVWTWVRDPHMSFIMSAYGTQPVYRDCYASQALIRSPWFQARWGDRFTIPNVTAVENVKNDKGGFRLGTTPGAGNATGWHANFQIYDDPNKPEECTAVGLTGTRDWYARTMSTRWRKPPEKNALICIMQRLHCDDLAQMFLDQGATHIMLPAEFDPTRRMHTAYGYDPRRERGELLDPVRLPTKLIGELRRNLGPINASAQLDQNPVPEGGAVFKKEWIKRYTPAEKPEHFDQVFSAHGTIMIFFVAMPFMIGLMNFVVPLQLGVRDVAFPTFNSVSFWLTASAVPLCNKKLRN